MTRKGKNVNQHCQLIDKVDLIRTILITRFIVFLTQFGSNLIFEQHNASDVFRSPNITQYLNNTTFRVFKGFFSWDAQYFLHITLNNGYIDEQFLAFFPLYPIILKLFPIRILPVAIFLLNIVLHYKITVLIFNITSIVFNNNIAKKSALLFCWNPATIFFVAAYSETLFAFLSFSVMYSCLNLNKVNVFVTIQMFCTLGFSTITRSNGLLNFGYFIYFAFIKKISIRVIVCIILFCLLPFFIFQYYAYFKFCLNNSIKSEWCNYLIPYSYSYIQKQYWNVGFLKYYQLKQLPNFILAFPIIFFIVNFVRNYFLKRFDIRLVPFILHAIFLSVFGLLFIHVQVLTRMLFSATPVPYWYAAFILHNYNFKNSFFLFSIPFSNRSRFIDKFICFYFLVYFFVGTIMFSLFLPWT